MQQQYAQSVKCQTATGSVLLKILEPLPDIPVSQPYFATVCQAMLAVQRRFSSIGRVSTKNKRPPDTDVPTVMDSNGNQVIQVEPGVTAPVDAVMRPYDTAMTGPGCLSMFNNAGAMSGKRFVRTSKPAAGSSLNVSAACCLSPCTTNLITCTHHCLRLFLMHAADLLGGTVC